MGFNASDAAALNKARDLGFPLVGDVDPTGEGVARFEIGPNFSSATTALDVSNALEAGALTFNSGVSTVWLDITLAAIPPAVVKGIELSSNFGMGLVVTHQGLCSHTPGQTLPAQLQNAVAAAGRFGTLWHPVLKGRVQAKL